MKKTLTRTNVLHGPANELLVDLDRFIRKAPWDENERLHFEEIPLREYALNSNVNSEWSALHRVLYDLAYVGYFLYSYDDVDGYAEPEEFVQYAQELFLAMGIQPPEVFLSGTPEMAVEQRHEHSNLITEGLKKIVHSAFALAWTQKSILYSFNLRLAKVISQLKKEDYPALEADGRMKRASYYPAWLLKAVMHRERGICHYCGCVVNPIFTPDVEAHMDHMVPLASGGTNDPTNFVLSCAACNLKKGANPQMVSDGFNWPSVGQGT